MAPKAQTAWSEGGTARTTPAPTSAPPLHSGPWATAGRRTAPCLRSAGPASEATGGRCASHSDFGRDCGSGVFGLTPPHAAGLCLCALPRLRRWAVRQVPLVPFPQVVTGVVQQVQQVSDRAAQPAPAPAQPEPQVCHGGVGGARPVQCKPKGPFTAGQRPHRRSGPQGVWRPPPPQGLALIFILTGGRTPPPWTPSPPPPSAQVQLKTGVLGTFFGDGKKFLGAFGARHSLFTYCFMCTLRSLSCRLP